MKGKRRIYGGIKMNDEKEQTIFNIYLMDDLDYISKTYILLNELINRVANLK